MENLVKNFFDSNGFPLSRNPNDLIFFSKYFIFCKEIVKDSQKYVPEFLEDIIEKNLNCINFIKRQMKVCLFSTEQNHLK